MSDFSIHFLQNWNVLVSGRLVGARSILEEMFNFISQFRPPTKFFHTISSCYIFEIHVLQEFLISLGYTLHAHTATSKDTPTHTDSHTNTHSDPHTPHPHSYTHLHSFTEIIKTYCTHEHTQPPVAIGTHPYLVWKDAKSVQFSVEEGVLYSPVLYFPLVQSLKCTSPRKLNVRYGLWCKKYVYVCTLCSENRVELPYLSPSWRGRQKFSDSRI